MHPDDGRVVSNFIVQALRGEEITIQGDGRQTRSFCYVDDLITGMIAMMDCEEVGPINLGNPNEFMILELAEKVIELTKSKSRLIHVALPEDDPRQRCPDIVQAKNRLGWEPKFNLTDGLTKTIEYFRTELDKT